MEGFDGRLTVKEDGGHSKVLFCKDDVQGQDRLDELAFKHCMFRVGP
jgi:hypothetical protein